MIQKVLIALCLWGVSAFGQPFSFHETRYSDGLARTFSLEGLITFNDQQTIIEYVKPQTKMLVYFEGMLSLQDEHGYRMIDRASAPSAHYFFMLIRALHEDDKAQLEAFFTWEEAGKKVHLVPKNPVDEVLENVDVVYKKEGLKSLHVRMKNKDWIRIEILD